MKFFFFFKNKAKHRNIQRELYYAEIQAYNIEKVQKRALRIIAYSNILSYLDHLNFFRLESLNERRKNLVLKFAKSLLTSDNLRHLLPPERKSNYLSEHTLRNTRQLEHLQIKTQRYKNSPVPSMLQMLNSISS